MIPRRRIPRPQALCKQLQDAKTPPAPRQRPQRQAKCRSKPAKYLGPLASTTPTAKQHTAAERRLYRAEARVACAAARARGETCPVLAAFWKLPWEMQNALTVPWTGNLRSNEITECHHKLGRRGKLLNWKPGWLLVSKFGHRAIHMFPKVAREFGWIAPEGQFNNQKLAT